jgi:hypothetical protein
LLDSDRLFPGHSTPAQQKAAYLLGKGIAVHVLERREAENYIPNRAIARHGDRSQVSRKLAALKTLTTQQRAHFDMKRGFRQKEGGPPKAPQDKLFENLQPRVARELNDGFGNTMIECLKYDDRELSRTDFASLGDGVEDELERLLSMISRVV